MSAQNAERATLANRLLDAMEFEAGELRRRTRVPPGQTEAERQAVERGNQFLSRHLPPERLRPPLARAYATLFTSSELLELITFFDSPVGKKLSRNQVNFADAMQETISAVYRENLEEYSRTVLQIPMPPDNTDAAPETSW